MTTYPGHRFAVIASESLDVPDEPTSYFILDREAGDVLGFWYADRTEAEDIANALNEHAAESVRIAEADRVCEPFCACGRVVSQCDGSRRGCGR
jgi:hypothetical protein